ncbi:MAG: hypothetical protein EOP73_14780 [Variovorax sp.]|nr:MAG: hypothetical protein EOP73_14780 [Variovorax sp.]
MSARIAVRIGRAALGGWIGAAAIAAASVPEGDVDLGRALYFGTRDLDAPARVDGVALPRGTTGCVQCHGALGEGVREGVRAAPALAGGRWTASRLREAMNGGAGIGGRPLAGAMPRFAPSAAEAGALAAHLAVLGTERDAVRGVTAREVALGIEGRAASRGAAARQVEQGVRRAVDEANARGGVHGRRLRLVDVDDAGADGAAPPVLALVGTLSTGPGKAAWLAGHRLPDAASLALLRERAAPRDWTVPLLPSLDEQVDLLERELLAVAAPLRCTPVEVAPGRRGAGGDAEATARGDGAAGTGGILRVADLRGPLDGRRLCVGSAGDPVAGGAAIRALEERGAVVPMALGLAVMGPMPPRAAPALEGRIVPVPRAVALASLRGDGLWPTLGYAAGRTVVEALARSGRRLQPEILLDRLRGLGGHAPIEGAPLTFGPRRTHGWLPEVDAAGDAAPAARIANPEGDRP